MSELFTQLGINLPALIAQAFNFLVVLVVLTIYVYRPLSKMMEERRLKIEAGLRGADEAEARLREIAEQGRLRAAQAEREALMVMQDAKRDADQVVKGIVSQGEARSAGIVEEARAQAERVRQDELQHLDQEARAYVRAVLQKTVELDPKLVDERLIDQALRIVKSSAHV